MAESKRVASIGRFELWFVAQLTFGLVYIGGAVFLIPPFTLSLPRATPGDVGVVMALMMITGLGGPLVGGQLERFGSFRLFQLLGMVFFAAGFGVLALVDELIGTAFAVILLGLGGTVVLTTNMSLMASSGLPDGDRNQRLSMLQMSTPLGQFIGLLIIALLIQLGLEFSGLFWVMAALAVVGLILTALTAGPAEQRARDAQASASPADAEEEEAPQMGLGAVLLTSFGLLLLVVAVWFSAHTILLSQYANLMKDVFSIDNNTAAVGMAVAVLLSIPLFPLVGRWLATAPYRLPLLVGIGLQTLAALGLWLISDMTGIPALVPLAIYGVIMLMLTLNDVSGAVLSTSTSPIGPSSGQGGYGFAMALGGILGAILAGAAADWLGFSGLPVVAAIGFVVAFVLTLFLPRIRAARSA